MTSIKDQPIPLVPTRIRRGFSVRARIFTFALVITILTTVVITAASAYLGFRTQRTKAFDTLTIASSLKESQINFWTRTVQETLLTTTTNQEVIIQIRELLANPQAKPIAYDLINFYRGVINQSRLYKDIYLIDPQGKVIITTNPNDPFGVLISQDFLINKEWEKIKPALARPYISSPYNSNLLGTVAVLVGLPISDKNGQKIGILAAYTNLDPLNEILRISNGLGETGQSYLVGLNQELLSLPRNETQKLLGMKVHSQAITDVTMGKNGENTYIDYSGEPVLGAYRWLPGLQVGLITEQSQQEIDGATFLTLLTNFLVSLGVMLVVIISSILMSRSIARPITNLASTAESISKGDFSARAPIEQYDEIGRLASTFNNMTEQISTLVANLEQRVAERTKELEVRAVQLMAASEIARDIAYITDLNTLLNSAVNLIRDRLRLYHAGIFLADESFEYAVLHAATGEAGAEMLNRGHKLKIGQVGMVGYAVAKGEPRIAFDVSADSVHFRNPLLPETRSEVALPLKLGNRTIGALDVQSTEPSAFTEDNIRILQTMADQLTVAIDKARLLQDFEDQVATLEAISRQYTDEAWREFIRGTQKIYQYRFHHSKIDQTAVNTPESQQALKTGEVVTNLITEVHNGAVESYTIIAVPIKFRDRVLGVVNLRYDQSAIPEDLLTLIQNATNRLALALDNARLMEEIRGHAESEHKVSQISTKVRAASDIDTLLSTAIQELGKALGVSEAVIHLNTPE